MRILLTVYATMTFRTETVAPDRKRTKAEANKAPVHKRKEIQGTRRGSLHSFHPQVIEGHIKRLHHTEGLGSVRRETKHFTDKTTLHGPKRIYDGKRFAQIFWLVVFCTSISLLIVQMVNLIKDYYSNPTVSSVSFVVNEAGISFPAVTLCNFNPIKYVNMQRINASGDFPMDLLDYVLESNMDAAALYSVSDRRQLQRGDDVFEKYLKIHPNFTIAGFFDEAGFNCEDLFVSCSFGSRQFPCCKYTKPVLTSLGKCFEIDVQGGPEWMKKQISAGVDSGLQMLMNSRQDDQILEDQEMSAIYSTMTENGFRFFVHERDKIPSLSSLGVSVSPATRVYTSLSTKQYTLLPGVSCSDQWPQTLKANLPYNVLNCETYCRAKYFNETCGCSPSVYNIDGYTVSCMDSKMGTITEEGAFDLNFPLCLECRIECDTWVYEASNSYGKEFNPGALRWIQSKNEALSLNLIQKNLLTINVFFRDLTHIQYQQQKSSSVTQLLSNIGGNMGLFLGMSLVTITECVIYLTKIFWILVDRRRRRYLLKKNQAEKAEEQEVKETVKGFQFFRNMLTRSLPRGFHFPLAPSSDHFGSHPLSTVN